MGQAGKYNIVLQRWGLIDGIFRKEEKWNDEPKRTTNHCSVYCITSDLQGEEDKIARLGGTRQNTV